MAKKQIRMDGSYYAKDKSVFQRPKKTGSGVKMMRTICRIIEGGPTMAKEIAAALNERMRRKEMDRIIERNRDEHEA